MDSGLGLAEAWIVITMFEAPAKGHKTRAPSRRAIRPAETGDAGKGAFDSFTLRESVDDLATDRRRPGLARDDADRSDGLHRCAGIHHDAQPRQGFPVSLSHRSRPSVGSRWRPLWAALTVLCLGLSLTAYIISLNEQTYRQQAQVSTVQFLTSLRARIEGDLYSTLYLGKSLTAYVATNPDIDQHEFSRLAGEIVIGARNIRNIALARDNVITHMYPLSGNQAALGLDYRKIEDQWPAVKRAIDLGSTVIAGPVELVQGGQGLIARTPIYLNPARHGLTEDGRSRYWGLSSLVIDVPRFVRNLRLSEQSTGYDIALRGRDGLGAEGGIILGKPELFEQEVIIQDVYLPNGTWQLAARPRDGWMMPILNLPNLYLGASASAIVAVLVGLLLHSRRTIASLALRDELTGLPNYLLLNDRLQQSAALAEREESGFDLVRIRVTGFDRINREFGRVIGDEVVREVARRLVASMRRADTVARSAEDEFTLLLQNTRNGSHIGQVLMKLQDIFSAPVFSGGESIKLEVEIGRSHFPSDGEGLETLLNNASPSSRGQTGNVSPLHARR